MFKVILHGCLQERAISYITLLQAKSKKGENFKVTTDWKRLQKNISKILTTEYYLKKQLVKTWRVLNWYWCKTHSRTTFSNKRDAWKFNKFFGSMPSRFKGVIEIKGENVSWVIISRAFFL